jgi:hypothetical protein
VNATRTGRRKRHAPVKKFVFTAKPRDPDSPLAPMQLSAWSVCAEDALRSVAIGVPSDWLIIPAGSE